MKFCKVIAVVAVMICVSFSSSAQTIGTTRFGVMGGFTSSNAKADVFSTSSYNLYHAGVTVQLPLGAGFAIQPALTYQVKGAVLDGIKEEGLEGFFENVAQLNTKVGFVEIPVQIQWGPDLLAFKPYVFAEPFVGFAVNTENEAKVAAVEALSTKVKDFKEAAISRLEYGLGFGAGIELWRLQISAKYYWNFGSLYSESGEMNAVGQSIKTAFADKKNFNGFSVSAAFFF